MTRATDHADQSREVYDRLSSDARALAHLATVWERLGDLPLREFCRMLGDLAARNGRSVVNVADVGCGTGRDLTLISKSLGSAVRAFGCDCSPGMLRHATGAGLTVERATIQEFLAPRAGAFDGIWCNYALIHLPGRAALDAHLRLIARGLRQGGAFGIGLKCGEGERLTDPADDKINVPRETTYWRASEVADALEGVGLSRAWTIIGGRPREPVPHEYTWFLGTGGGGR